MTDREYIRTEREKLEKLYNSPQYWQREKAEYYHKKTQELNELEKKLMEKEAEDAVSISLSILFFIFVFSGFDFGTTLAILIFVIIALTILVSIISALTVIIKPSSIVNGKFRIQTRCFRK